MFPTMSIHNPRTTPEAIVNFERSHELALPSLYKEFLLATNGGRPESPAFPIEGMPLNPIGAVSEFFGLGAKAPMADLVEIADQFRNGIPPRLLPIARTDGSDYICLDLRNDQHRVLFWDNRPFWGTGVWQESDLYPIASSFEEFLSALRPNPY